MQTVLPEAINHHREENEKRECNRDDDVARNREGIGDDADHVQHENEHEQREHEREKFHALGAGGGPPRTRDELVRHFRDRLQPARHQGARMGGAEHQKKDQGQPDQHEKRRIREGKLDPAHAGDWKEVFDLKLIDGVHTGLSSSSLRRRAGASRAGGPLHCFEPGGSNVLLATTPAARITLRTPAAKPRSRNTIIPQGEIPSQRSRSQPIAAPTTTPATNSVESRKPRAIADGSAGGGGAVPLSEGRPAAGRPSRPPRRLSLAESAASSGGSCSRSPFSRASSAMLSTPATVQARSR